MNSIFTVLSPLSPVTLSTGQREKSDGEGIFSEVIDPLPVPESSLVALHVPEDIAFALLSLFLYSAIRAITFFTASSSVPL